MFNPANELARFYRITNITAPSQNPKNKKYII